MASELPLAPEAPRLALGAREVAASLGISERSFRRGLATGRIPPGVRLGGRVLWPADLLRAWANAGMPANVSLEALQAAQKGARS
jgi:predicted DNA-binding transcriptional regulator AlpA